MNVKAIRAPAAMFSLAAFFVAVLVIVTARWTAMWGGRDFLVVTVLVGAWSASAIAGIASLRQPRMRWLGLACALLSLYFIVMTWRGIRAL